MQRRPDGAADRVSRTWLSWSAVAAGLALVGYGAATHLSADGARAAFHPLFVLAPVAAGLLLVGAGVAVGRR